MRGLCVGRLGVAVAKGGGDGDDGAPRRGRPRSVETTNAILESAYAMMAATGLAATTIDAVARRFPSCKVYAAIAQRLGRKFPSALGLAG